MLKTNQNLFKIVPKDLPKSLSPSEQLSLLNLARKGDLKAKQALILSFLRFSVKVAFSTTPKRYMDEAISTAMYATVQAVTNAIESDVNHTGGIKQYIRGAILKSWHRARTLAPQSKLQAVWLIDTDFAEIEFFSFREHQTKTDSRVLKAISEDQNVSGDIEKIIGKISKDVTDLQIINSLIEGETYKKIAAANGLDRHAFDIKLQIIKERLLSLIELEKN